MNDPTTQNYDQIAQEYLKSLAPSREEVDTFLETPEGDGWLSRNRGVTHDSDLGWVHADAFLNDGVEKSGCQYNYDRSDGARLSINFPDRDCRIHTYGDSFTHCDQVSNGETWQEHLAAHLQEPIRNYGVGGFSVYQAYLRMRKVERDHPSENIILNIYDHDHARNLVRFWAIYFGQRVRCGFTCPHLRVNVNAGTFETFENPLSRPEEVYQLCDPDYLLESSLNDPTLPVALDRHDHLNPSPELVEQVSEQFGVSTELASGHEPDQAITTLFREAGLYATRCVMEMVESFVNKTNKNLMVILSHNPRTVQEALEGQPRRDQTFLDFIHGRGYPVIDMRDAFIADHATTNLNAAEYLRCYYNGHHNPAGNFFTAWTIREAVVDLLEPKPRPYL